MIIFAGISAILLVSHCSSADPVTNETGRRSNSEIKCWGGVKWGEDAENSFVAPKLVMVSI
jgi:hypothetical protein